MDQIIKETVIIITGSTSGIAKSTAIAFAKRGNAVNENVKIEKEVVF